MSTAVAPALKYPQVGNLIDGQASYPDAAAVLDVYDPARGDVIARVPLSGVAAVDAAVRAAQRALPGWAGTPIKERVQIFFRYRQLLEQHLPGPKLVPGSGARPAEGEIPAVDWRAENKGAGG